MKLSFTKFPLKVHYAGFNHPNAHPFPSVHYNVRWPAGAHSVLELGLVGWVAD